MELTMFNYHTYGPDPQPKWRQEQPFKMSNKIINFNDLE